MYPPPPPVSNECVGALQGPCFFWGGRSRRSRRRSSVHRPCPEVCGRYDVPGWGTSPRPELDRPASAQSAKRRGSRAQQCGDGIPTALHVSRGSAATHMVRTVQQGSVSQMVHAVQHAALGATTDWVSGQRLFMDTVPEAPPQMVRARLANSVCQLRHDQMEQGPTEPHAGRSTFLLSSGGAGFAKPTETNVHGDGLCGMAKTCARRNTTETVLSSGWRLAVGGWRLAVGGWRLAVGGWWSLEAVFKGCP